MKNAAIKITENKTNITGLVASNELPNAGLKKKSALLGGTKAGCAICSRCDKLSSPLTKPAECLGTPYLKGKGAPLANLAPTLLCGRRLLYKLDPNQVERGQHPKAHAHHGQEIGLEVSVCEVTQAAPETQPRDQVGDNRPEGAVIGGGHFLGALILGNSLCRQRHLGADLEKCSYLTGEPGDRHRDGDNSEGGPIQPLGADVIEHQKE